MPRLILVLVFLFTLPVWGLANPTDSLRLEKRGQITYIIHRVVKGENISSICSKYGIVEAQIYSHNPIIINEVYPGQLVKVPVAATKYGQVEGPEVKPLTTSKLPLAQTLPKPKYSPTLHKDIKEHDEVQLNPGVVDYEPGKAEVKLTSANPDVVINEKDDTLFPLLPSGKRAAGYRTFVASSPQTVEQVGNTFSVDPKDIIEVNKLTNYRLKAGQKIQIPVYESTTPVAKSVAPVVKDTAKSVVPAIASAPKQEPQGDTAKMQATAKAKPIDTVANRVKTLIANEPITIPTTNTLEYSKEDAASKAKTREEFDEYIPEWSYLDSSDIHLDGGVYKVFSYKDDKFFRDPHALAMAEENAIEVSNIHQRNGYGNKQYTHLVERGETLQSIARRYKVSATDLINWNGLIAYKVRVGQELIVNNARAEVSPYVRTTVSQPKIPANKVLKKKIVFGMAYYDNTKSVKGVYMNGVPAGKFVYVVNKEKFTETFAQVLGPLPPKMPKNTVIYLDKDTARKLKVDTESARVEIEVGLLEDEAKEQEEVTTDK